jgi:SNF2 family DNA or RNA helicase
VHEAAKLTARDSLELSGSVRQLEQWQAGEAPVLAVQIQSGGTGVDLTRAAYCVYLSTGFSLGDYEQSLARVHRPGQDRTVFYYHIVAKDTVDEKVYAALRARKKVVEAILDEVSK